MSKLELIRPLSILMLLACLPQIAAAQITSCGNAAAANGTVAGRTGYAIYLLNCTTGSNPRGYSVNSASLELGTTVAGSIEAAVYNANVTARLCTVAAGQAAVAGVNTVPLTGQNCNDPGNTANSGVGLAPNTTYKIALAYSNPVDLRLTTAGTACTTGAAGAQFMQFRRGDNSSPAATFPLNSTGDQPWATKCAFRLYLNLTAVGATPPTANPGIALLPTSASLQTGASKQFTASVTGTSNTAVTWKANGGSINASGIVHRSAIRRYLHGHGHQRGRYQQVGLSPGHGNSNGAGSRSFALAHQCHPAGRCQPSINCFSHRHQQHGRHLEG